MKRFLLAISVATATLVSATAQETVKTLYSGEPKQVSWSNTITFTADQFTDGVAVGNYISIKTTSTSGAIELKANGTWLPGTRQYDPGTSTEQAEFRTYITDDMLKSLKEYGLELCGAEFTLAEATIGDDGFEMPQGAIWGGYSWVENWSSLFIFKTAFDSYDGQRYMDIYLSEGDLDGFTGYFLQVMTQFDNADAMWAANGAITHEAGKAIVDLKGINVKEALADVNTLIIQGNKEGGNPFNITAVALRPESSTTEISDITTEETEVSGNVYNLQGMVVKSDVTVQEATASLPAGIYIINGKKIAIK